MDTRILHFLLVFLLCLAYRLGITASSFSGGRLRLDNVRRQLRTAGDHSSSNGHEVVLDLENNVAGSRKHPSNYEVLLKLPDSDKYRFRLDNIIRNQFNSDKVFDDEPIEEEDHHNILFVFGDSLFDGGNNKYINNEDYGPSNYPYGYTYFTNATGRVCDGRIVPDFIAQYAGLPLIPPSMEPGANFSYGANFASGGSAVLDSDSESSINVISLREQVSQFKEMAGLFNKALGLNGTRQMLGKAVYLFSAGGNDYLEFYERFNKSGRSPTLSEQEQFVKAVVGNLTDAILEIYEVGARKISFQNVGPMGCLPSVDIDYPKLNGSCAPELLSMPVLHNEELYEALTGLADRLDGFKFSIMDYFSSLYARMMDPSNYGFNFGREFCYDSNGDAYRVAKAFGVGNYQLCEYPSAYVFFDVAHTTQSVNEQFAKLIWSGDPSVTRPYNVKQLFEEV